MFRSSHGTNVPIIVPGIGSSTIFLLNTTLYIPGNDEGENPTCGFLRCSLIWFSFLLLA